MRALLRLGLVLVWLLAALLPASAASVIFYSKADNSYGWCAGYSYGRGESCARQQCLEYGSGCELAIECDGGWSATAFAPDPFEGFGASCEWQSAGVARSVALMSCIYASHALCTTSDAFDGNARSASDNANDAYDLAWYTQSLLLYLGYDIGEVDGQIGSKTRSAIRQFQSAIGLEPTGEAEWSLMWYLTYVAGGPGRLVADTIAAVDASDPKVVQTYTYRYAAVPAPDLPFTDEVANLNEEWRRNILAALVTYYAAPCAVPAATTTQSEDPGIWAVTCAEGNYYLALHGRTPVISRADDPIDIRPIPVDCPTEGPIPDPGRNQKPSSNTLNDPGPGYKPSLNSENSVNPGRDYKPSLDTTNSQGPLADLVPAADCPPPVPTDCPPADPGTNNKPSLATLNQPGPGKTYKPSLATENAPLSDYKPSMDSTNSPGPLGDLVQVDCPPPMQADFKPSPNTVNGMAPGLAAALGSAGGN